MSETEALTAADHPPNPLHTVDQYEDGGIGRMCTAAPWIGEDDAFLVQSLQEKSRHRASNPTLSTGLLVFRYIVRRLQAYRSG